MAVAAGRGERRLSKPVAGRKGGRARGRLGLLCGGLRLLAECGALRAQVARQLPVEVDRRRQPERPRPQLAGLRHLLDLLQRARRMGGVRPRVARLVALEEQQPRRRQPTIL